MANSFLGLDVSLTSTGVAFVRDDGTHETWRIETHAKQPLPERLHDIYLSIKALVSDEAQDHEVQTLCCMEQGFSGGKGPAAMALGRASGVAMLAAQHLGLTVRLLAPNTRAKLATGQGTADKTQVVIAARERLGYRGTSNDEADALWLAVAAYWIDASCSLPNQWKIPKTHTDALSKYMNEANGWS